jgi:hypothetical protein
MGDALMKIRIGFGVATTVLVTSIALTAGAASAAALKVCVPEKEGKSFLTPTKGACKKGYQLSEVPGEEETKLLNEVVPHVRFEEKGVAGKPTIRFTGVNVQVVNGAGVTETTNGEGNLVIGYDESTGEQTGSHNLILDTAGTFTSYGGILAGFDNSITAPWASVTGGLENVASGKLASVTGGAGNVASGERASVTGGDTNTASGGDSAVAGGTENKAEGEQSSVEGGAENLAEARLTSIFGGRKLTAKGEYEALP